MSSSKSYKSGESHRHVFYCLNCDFESFSHTRLKLHYKVKHKLKMTGKPTETDTCYLCASCKKAESKCNCSYK